MLKITTFFLALIFISSGLLAQLTTKDYVIQVEAVTKSDSNLVRLNWKKHRFAVNYLIFRTNLSTTETNVLANLDSIGSKNDSYSFADKELEANTRYMYEIVGYSGIQANYANKTQLLGWGATGYITTGVNLIPKESQGKVLLVIDDTLKSLLKPEITTLTNDLIAEGWVVHTTYVPRTTKFNKGNVRVTKDSILKYFYDYGITSVYLLGRVAVPYSGLINPDAHPDHLGAWPADMYYGIIDESNWTDTKVDSIAPGSRVENRNIPNDGKFDVSKLDVGEEVTLEIGRVDFYNLKVYKESEIELLRNYLNKARNYRIGNFKPRRKAFISDNFGVIGSFTEAFASTGWRNFAPLVGADNITSGSYFDSLGADTYLAAYGCGGGSYTSVGGIGNSASFANKPVKATFTYLFGSYFGDWDNQDNLMRTALASKDQVLTCAWSGRPYWYMDEFVSGSTIGKEALKAMNNLNLYNLFYLTTYNGTNFGGKGVFIEGSARRVHISLLGDPTLRVNDYTDVPEPFNVKLKQNPDRKKLEISWEVEPGGTNNRFDVYRSTDTLKSFTKINSTPIKESKFDDYVDGKLNVFYQIRNINDITNPAGTFQMYSRGALNNIVLDGTLSIEDNDNSTISIAPNPTSDELNIFTTGLRNGTLKINLKSIDGGLIANIYNGLFENQLNLSYNLKDKFNLSSGVYLLEFENNDEKIIKKIVLNK